jgi:hypothetical protein
MLTRFLVFFASFAICFVAASATPDVPDHVTILPTSEGPKIVKQCSRSDPAEVSDFWLPSAADVAASEKSLQQLLRDSGHKIDLGNSYRQYIGVVSCGKKLIYVNAFPGPIFVRPPSVRLGKERLWLFVTAEMSFGEWSSIPSRTSLLILASTGASNPYVGCQAWLRVW